MTMFKECAEQEDVPLVHLLHDPAVVGTTAAYESFGCDGDSVMDDVIDQCLNTFMNVNERDLMSGPLDKIISFFEEPSETPGPTLKRENIAISTITTTLSNEVEEEKTLQEESPASDEAIPGDEESPSTKYDRPKPKKSRNQTKRPRKPKTRRKPDSRANRNIHLWEFILELLNDGTSNYVQWINKPDGTFRLVNSSAVAKLWGQRKNRQNMTYEKMSRALRYYYEKQILERVPNARLIYKFGNRTRDRVSETSEETLSDSSENSC